jgi:hypothetical protein
MQTLSSSKALQAMIERSIEENIDGGVRATRTAAFTIKHM